MRWFLILWTVLGTPSGFSQTYLELSANVDGAVCPGVDVVYNCTTDDRVDVKWTAQPYFDTFTLLRSSLVEGPIIEGPISIARISRDPFTSTLTITYSEDIDSTEVICNAGDDFVEMITYRRILDTSTLPVVSAVNIADVINEANTLRLILQFTIANGRGTPTLEVSPSAVSLGSLQNTTSSTFSTDITLLYNTNYTLTITANNCVGKGRQHINFLTVNCSIPNVTADVRVWPFTDTTEGATIIYSCSDGYLPQTNQTSQCTQAGGSGYWVPYPAPSCSIVCSVLPSLMAIPLQANESHPYVEGDVVNFQCLFGLSPADVMNVTCTMEGSWRPDPQHLNCSSTTEDTTAIQTARVNVPVVVAGICFFMLGLLCGAAAGVGAVIIYIKCSRETCPSSSQPQPPAPLYDDIELPTTTEHKLELKHNVAYGHVN